ncbi:MAG: hypothetical protein KTR25_04240 [Myxococcales bacterium]|nr:hypothetical protein [Myxococcales bacterium]
MKRSDDEASVPGGTRPRRDFLMVRTFHGKTGRQMRPGLDQPAVKFIGPNLKLC